MKLPRLDFKLVEGAKTYPRSNKLLVELFKFLDLSTKFSRFAIFRAGRKKNYNLKMINTFLVTGKES